MTLMFGTPWESSRQQWAQLSAPWAFVLVWPGFAAYAVGVFAASSVALRQLSRDP
jgi:hypothetical protein